jgi:two-component system, LuxR family, response regulator FixJ
MRILVIEDDDTMARSIAAILTKDGATIDIAKLGAVGVKLGKRDVYALIVLDLALPDFHGLTVLKELRAANIQTPTLVVSGDSNIEMRINCFEAGADDYVTKPFQMDEFVARVHAASRRGIEHAEMMKAARDAAARLAMLTPRERDVVDLIVAGRSNKVAAYELGISHRTIELHRARIMDKMKIRSIAELVRIVLAAAPLGNGHDPSEPLGDEGVELGRFARYFS